VALWKGDGGYITQESEGAMAKLLVTATYGHDNATRAAMPFFVAKGAKEAGIDVGSVLALDAAVLVKPEIRNGRGGRETCPHFRGSGGGGRGALRWKGQRDRPSPPRSDLTSRQGISSCWPQNQNRRPR
jgi:hypothetical protein